MKWSAGTVKLKEYDQSGNKSYPEFPALIFENDSGYSEAVLWSYDSILSKADLEQIAHALNDQGVGV